MPVPTVPVPVAPPAHGLDRGGLVEGGGHGGARHQRRGAGETPKPASRKRASNREVGASGLRGGRARGRAARQAGRQRTGRCHIRTGTQRQALPFRSAAGSIPGYGPPRGRARPFPASGGLLPASLAGAGRRVRCCPGGVPSRGRCAGRVRGEVSHAAGVKRLYLWSAAAALLAGGISAAEAGCLRRVVNRSPYFAVASATAARASASRRTPRGRSACCPGPGRHRGPLRRTRPARAPRPGRPPVAQDSYTFTAVLDRCYYDLGLMGFGQAAPSRSCSIPPSRAT